MDGNDDMDTPTGSSPMDDNDDMDVLPSNTPDAEEMDAIMRQPSLLGDDWSSDEEAGSPPPLASAHLHNAQAEIIRAQRARIQVLVRSQDDVSRLQDELVRAMQTENDALRQANARLAAQETPRQASPATVPCSPHELHENFIDLVSDDSSSDSDENSSTDSSSSDIDDDDSE